MRYPSPGSQVPGAPPPLKRALTPADGLAVAAPQLAAPAGTGPAVAARGERTVSADLTAAAAMTGIAVGLELARCLRRRQRRRE